jgi:exodeoxyribonuclease-3
MTDSNDLLNIYSWNVNGLRACTRKGFAKWLQDSDAHIVGVQELRALREQLPKKVSEPEGWHTHFFPAESKKGYSGVGLFSKIEPDQMLTSVDVERFDREGRVQIAQFGELKLLNVYFPNGSGTNRDLSRIPYKLDFYDHLFEMLQPALERGERLVVMGDFNTAHQEIDLARPKSNHETSGFRPEERESFGDWLDAGWTDTFRHVCDEPERYTWWTYRGNCRERNVGWRIDYALASPGAMEFLVDADIHHDVMGSDHCPLSVTFDRAVLG